MIRPLSEDHALDHLYSIRAGLLDIEDAGKLDARAQARLTDVESEIASVHAVAAKQVRDMDVGWARLEDLAVQVFYAIVGTSTPPRSSPQVLHVSGIGRPPPTE